MEQTLLPEYWLNKRGILDINSPGLPSRGAVISLLPWLACTLQGTLHGNVWQHFPAPGNVSCKLEKISVLEKAT
jgi:hypothetical protein